MKSVVESDDDDRDEVFFTTFKSSSHCSSQCQCKLINVIMAMGCIVIIYSILKIKCQMKSTFIAKFATYNIYHLHEHDECHETKRIVYRDGNMT